MPPATSRPEVTDGPPAGPPYRIHPRRPPATARVEGHLLADTGAALRVETDGGRPALFFPPADVHLDRLAAVGSPVRLRCGVTAEPWTTADSDGSDEPTAWLALDAPDHLRDLVGTVTFDDTRVAVELIDTDPTDDPRAATVTSFPTWGDAADLVEVIDVGPVDPTHYRSVARPDWRRPVVEGSQILGQAIVAASRHTGGRRVVSAMMAFPRAADAATPLEFELTEITHGRTFSTIGMHVTQADRCCGAGTLLLDEGAPDVIRHQVAAPAVAGPLDSAPCDMSVNGRDVRVVDAAYTGDPDAPVGPPTIDAWVRFRQLPADPAVHAGLLAQFTGHMSIAAALRPHRGIGQDAAHRTLSTAINAISISLHAEPRADRWMLYRHESTFAGDGMTRSTCRVHDESGAFLASFEVDAMVRDFADPTHHPDERTSL